jgi:hypothetical protein
MPPRWWGFLLCLIGVPMLRGACEYIDPEGGRGTGVAERSRDTSISGVVRDAAGQSMGMLDLQLVTIGESGEIGELVPLRRCATTEPGEFTIRGIPPGRYYLGVNLRPPLTGRVPRTFYPGTRLRERAIPLETRAEESIKGLILSTPDYGRSRTLRILVVDQNGIPVPDAWISSAEYPDAEPLGSDEEVGGMAALGLNLKTDVDGVAIVEGFAGAWYRIRAERSNWVWTVSRRGVTIAPGEKAVTILLVL